MNVQESNHLHSRANDVLKRLRSLDRRLGNVANSVAGMKPETGGSEVPKAIDECLHDKFNDITRTINELEDEMSRLENSVGTNSQAPKSATAAASGY